MNRTLPRVPYMVIQDAIKGEEYALQEVLRIFAPYLKALSTKRFYNEYGRCFYRLNNDLYAYLQSKLILAIIHNFKLLDETK